MSLQFQQALLQWYNLGAAFTALQNVPGATLMCWSTFTAPSVNLEDRLMHVSSGTAVGASRLQMAHRQDVVRWRASGRRLDADAVASIDSVTPLGAARVHVATVARYSAQSFELYVNGALEASSAQPTWTGNSSNTASLGAALGASSDGTGNLNGLLEGCRIYTRALSAQEIANIFAARGRDGNTFGLLHRWQMQNGFPGSVANTAAAVDTGTGARNGVATGTPNITFQEWLSGNRRRRRRR